MRIGAGAIVELTRNVPLLIHLYIWLIGLAFLRLPPFLCGVLGLAIYSGAYVAEIVRGGIASVPVGQGKAALATGLTPIQALLFVVSRKPGASFAVARQCVLAIDQGFFARLRHRGDGAHL